MLGRSLGNHVRMSTTSQPAQRYACLNPRCPNYAGAGVVLTRSDVRPDSERRLLCNACSSYVQYADPGPSRSTQPVAGMAVGAAIGAAVGGGAGAVVGGLVGLLIASSGSNGSSR